MSPSEQMIERKRNLPTLAQQFQEFASLVFESRKPVSPELLAEFQTVGLQAATARGTISRQSGSGHINELIIRRNTTAPYIVPSTPLISELEIQKSVMQPDYRRAAYDLARYFDSAVDSRSLNFTAWVSQGRGTSVIGARRGELTGRV